MSLQGKVVVITGGAGGIGRASSLRLARDGAAVSIWDVDMPVRERWLGSFVRRFLIGRELIGA